jgi:diaminohydroxyphosphoribosylaminopyrimidine deaminase/5-amino-6-(5-phosphoribosylamino)uracil reductase
LEQLREQRVEVELGDSFRARRQNEAWRTWVALGRPFVILKAAVTLDGRATIPGSRWITGDAARKRVHALRAEVDAVAVGMGTVRADDPKLSARDVGAARQPRRLAFGRGPLPTGSDLELRTGGLQEELRVLAGEGVQSVLLEGGPTITQSFLRDDLVDKVLVFVAPRIAGDGIPFFPAGSSVPRQLTRLSAEPVGEDVLLTAYIHEP